MVDIVAYDSDGAALENISDFTMDMQYGDDQNDFTLYCSNSRQLSPQYLIGVEGTEIGGIIGRVLVQHEDDASVVGYEGSTWHGMLDKKVLEPDKGADYLTVSGEVNQVLDTLVKRVKLDDIFTASSADSGLTLTNFKFDRYATAYQGIRKMLDSVGGKLVMSFSEGHVTLSAVKAAIIANTVDSDVMNFTLTRDDRRTNHLIGLGEGELKARAVSHWYADKDGKVSQTQTLFGVQEITDIYDYSSAKAEELGDETKKKLLDLQGQGDIDVTIRDGHTFDIGDQISGRDNITGTLVTARVSKKIIKVENGILSTTYEVGKETTSTSLSGSAESSAGGGRIYLAGDGLTLADDGVTFSAEVTQAELDAVSAKTDKSVTDISNLSATVGANSAAVVKAQSTADAAVSQVSTLSQDLTGFKNTVSGTYATKSALDSTNGNVSNAQTAANLALQNAQELVKNGNFDPSLGNPDDAGNNINFGSSKAPTSPPIPFNSYAELTARDMQLDGVPIVAEQGRTYQFSAWLLADSTATRPCGVGWNYARQDRSHNWETAFKLYPADVSVWTKFTGTLTIPADASSYIKLWIFIDGWDGVDTNGWYITGLSCKDITEAQAAQKAAEDAQATANNAQVSADNAKALANAAQAAAQGAQTTADSAKSTASTAVQSVTAAAPLSATRSANTVSLKMTAASTSTAGSMSAVDKVKLDGIAEGANAYTLPAATTSTLGGVKPDGKTITVSSDGTLTAHSDSEAASFLAAYPIGSTYKTISPTNPGTTYGGTWVEVDSLDYFTYERTA